MRAFICQKCGREIWLDVEVYEEPITRKEIAAENRNPIRCPFHEGHYWLEPKVPEPRRGKTIEEIAIELVQVRRQKIVSKNKRNELLNECRLDSGRDPCLVDMEAEELCEVCEEAKKHQHRYQHLRERGKDLMRQLEKAVMRGPRKEESHA